MLTVEDSNGNIEIMKADSHSSTNTVLNGDYTGKQAAIGAEGGVQKVYIIEPSGDNNAGDDQRQ